MPRADVKKVLLADDHLYISETLRLFMEDHAADRFEVTAVARDGAQALAEARRRKPDLVVMDVQMPKMTGIEALREMKKLKPAPVVLILSAYDDRAHMLEALQAGADDYVFKKDMTPERLVAHLDRAVAKTLPTQGPVADAMLEAVRALPSGPELTHSEMEILRLAAYRGASAKDISLRISGGKMSIRTVATHWQNIYDKLGVQSQAQAVCMAIKKGIINAEPVQPA